MPILGRLQVKVGLIHSNSLLRTYAVSYIFVYRGFGKRTSRRHVITCVRGRLMEATEFLTHPRLSLTLIHLSLEKSFQICWLVHVNPFLCCQLILIVIFAYDMQWIVNTEA